MSFSEAEKTQIYYAAGGAGIGYMISGQPLAIVGGVVGLLVGQQVTAGTGDAAVAVVSDVSEEESGGSNAAAVAVSSGPNIIYPETLGWRYNRSSGQMFFSYNSCAVNFPLAPKMLFARPVAYGQDGFISATVVAFTQTEATIIMWSTANTAVKTQIYLDPMF